MNKNLYTLDDLRVQLKREQKNYAEVIETEQDFVTAKQIHTKIIELKKAVDDRLMNEVSEDGKWKEVLTD